MKKMANEFWKVAFQYKRREFVGLLCTILYSGSIFMSTLVSKYLIDEVITSQSLNKMFIGIIVFMFGCMGQPIFGYFKNKIFMKISEDIVMDYRIKMFEKILYTPIQFFENNKNGEIVSRICNDGITISDFLTNFFVVFIKNIILIIMIFIGMLLMSPILTCIVVVLFTGYAFINYKMSKEFSTLSKKCRESYDEICVNINQSINQIDTIKSFTQERIWKDKFIDIAKESYSNNLKVRNKNNLLDCFSTSIVVLSLTIVYGIGGYLIMSGKSTIGTIAAFGLFFQNLSSPIYEFMNANIDLKKTEPILRRINEYLNLAEERKSDMELNEIGSIEFRNVSFSFGNDNAGALKNINLDFASNGLFALVGDSGAGKSTIMKLLCAYYDNYKGDILINDIELCSYGVINIRNMISIVSQEVELMNDTIMNNVLMGQKHSEEEVKAVCSFVKLNEVIEALTDGYNTIINERINLSGGEKQRLAIARAIMKKARIYVFDEPTAALDNINEMHIKKLIEELAKDNLVIVITHNLYLLNKSDYIYTMREGEVVEKGTYNNLINSGCYFAELIHTLNKTG